MDKKDKLIKELRAEIKGFDKVNGDLTAWNKDLQKKLEETASQYNRLVGESHKQIVSAYTEIGKLLAFTVTGRQNV